MESTTSTDEGSGPESGSIATAAAAVVQLQAELEQMSKELQQARTNLLASQASDSEKTRELEESQRLVAALGGRIGPEDKQGRWESNRRLALGGGPGGLPFTPVESSGAGMESPADVAGDSPATAPVKLEDLELPSPPVAPPSALSSGVATNDVMQRIEVMTARMEARETYLAAVLTELTGVGNRPLDQELRYDTEEEAQAADAAGSYERKAAEWVENMKRLYPGADRSREAYERYLAAVLDSQGYEQSWANSRVSEGVRQRQSDSDFQRRYERSAKFAISTSDGSNFQESRVRDASKASLSRNFTMSGGTKQAQEVSPVTTKPPLMTAEAEHAAEMYRAKQRLADEAQGAQKQIQMLQSPQNLKFDVLKEEDICWSVIATLVKTAIVFAAIPGNKTPLLAQYLNEASRNKLLVLYNRFNTKQDVLRQLGLTAPPMQLTDAVLAFHNLHQFVDFSRRALYPDTPEDYERQLKTECNYIDTKYGISEDHPVLMEVLTALLRKIKTTLEILEMYPQYCVDKDPYGKLVTTTNFPSLKENRTLSLSGAFGCVMFGLGFNEEKVVAGKKQPSLKLALEQKLALSSAGQSKEQEQSVAFYLGRLQVLVQREIAAKMDSASIDACFTYAKPDRFKIKSKYDPSLVQVQKRQPTAVSGESRGYSDAPWAAYRTNDGAGFKRKAINADEARPLARDSAGKYQARAPLRLQNSRQTRRGLSAITYEDQQRLSNLRDDIREYEEDYELPHELDDDDMHDLDVYNERVRRDSPYYTEEGMLQEIEFDDSHGYYSASGVATVTCFDQEREILESVRDYHEAALASLANLSLHGNADRGVPYGRPPDRSQRHGQDPRDQRRVSQDPRQGNDSRHGSDPRGQDSRWPARAPGDETRLVNGRTSSPAQREARAKLACGAFMEGKCSYGLNCEFSHKPEILKARYDVIKANMEGGQRPAVQPLRVSDRPSPTPTKSLSVVSSKLLALSDAKSDAKSRVSWDVDDEKSKLAAEYSRNLANIQRRALVRANSADEESEAYASGYSSADS